MKILKLTSSDNNQILVNFQNVTHATPTENGSIIYTIKEEGYHVIHVLENLDEILEKIEK